MLIVEIGMETRLRTMHQGYGRVTLLTYVCRHLPRLINLQNDNGHTCLHCAVHNDHLPSVRVLLKHHVDVRVRDKRGRTALDWAELWSSRDIVEELEGVSFVFSFLINK